ncbi:MAG: AAA family ATPase [Oscillospiraceae bacterium]|nr:AAA family ATPase [Oscillospiraceae bacterium]
MAKVISISNQKGGVGKTTTSLAISTGFKERGFRVLAVDMDPQANFTFSLGGEGDDGPTVYELLKGEVQPRFAIQRTSYVDLIASNIVLSGAELEFTAEGREYILKKALKSLMPRYDYIVIDTPPALSFLTVNALAAAQYMIIPMQADIFSLQGIAQLGDSLLRLKQYCNPQLEVGGILLCRFDGRTILGRRINETADMVAQQIGTKLYKQKIRNSVAIQEAQTNQVSMFQYAPQSPGVADYRKFVDELLKSGV